MAFEGHQAGKDLGSAGNAVRPRQAPAPFVPHATGFWVFIRLDWWRTFVPARSRIDSRERPRILTGLMCHLMRGGLDRLPWLIAPLDARAVLVFALPAGPMMQPWAVVGGNTLSALVGNAGVHGVHLLGAIEVAAALSVGTALALMLMLRCPHQPGAVIALMMVLSGIGNPIFALYPVLDVSRDDLKALLAQTQLRAYDRKLAEVRCADIMSRDLVTVEFCTPLQEVWELLCERRIKALPVIDRTFRIAGIVTLTDGLKIIQKFINESLEVEKPRVKLLSPSARQRRRHMVRRRSPE